MGLLAHILPFFNALLTMLVPPQEASMVFAGDAMQHKAQLDAALSAGGGRAYDYSECFGGIRAYVEEADYAVVNFEASLGGRPYTGYPCFSAPDEYPLALKACGFDFFLLANNHILDRRDRGMHRTISTLDSLGIPHSGVYHSADHRAASVPAIVDVNGFAVAILNYTYGTNGITLSGRGVVDYIDRATIRSDVELARTRGAELVAVCVHWGDEYRLLPNGSQRSLADYLCSLDVDMIIGGHPHVIQPMEMRTGPSGRSQFLVYSLGNFISNMKTTDTRGGVMVKVSLRRDDSGRAYVAGAGYLPVFTEPPSAGHNFRLVHAPQSADSRAAAFMRSAEAIFTGHNRGVERDTTFTAAPVHN